MKSLVTLPLLLATLLPASGFDLINVNFNGFTGGTPGPTQDASTLVGPAGGLGTSWNQYADEDSSGVLVDSTGAATTVTVATNFSEGRYDGTAPALTMLRATLTDFAKGTANRTVTISGLEAGGSYNVWLVSHRHQSSAAERQAGIWTTAHATSSPPSQIVDGRAGALNGATFVAGVNYALYQSVVADGSGVITFVAAGGKTTNGFDADYRMHLNGLQIAPAAPPVPPQPLEFTEIVRHSETDEVTLTWKSNPGEKYGLYWSDDLVGFVMHGTHHAVPAHPAEDRTTLGPIASPLPDADKLFFLVGPPDLSNPALSQAFGSGNTVTLQFSEAIHPDSVGNLANFSVTVGGVPLSVLGATLDASGKIITLTLDGSLLAGTEYNVVAQNVTTLAGRVIPTAFNGNFQTWDDDPNGIQVFILAGQSNMVGYGKTEDGGNPAWVSGGTEPKEIPGGLGCLRYLANNNASFPEYDYTSLLVDPGQPVTSPWRVRSDVKVWWKDGFLEDTRNIRKGNLGPPFLGASNGGGTWFGPEYAFGQVIGNYYSGASERPVLIVKTAWGGISLGSGFRPPSAVADRGGEVGPYYVAMLADIREILGNLEAQFPAAQHPEFAARDTATASPASAGTRAGTTRRSRSPPSTRTTFPT
jgi:hypothetical protein